MTHYAPGSNDGDPLTRRIIGCAMEVHRLPFVRQAGVPVFYKGHLIGEHRPDLVIEDRVVVKVKSVERLIGVHQAQLLAYMRVLGKPVGLLLNFNSEVLRTGIRRLVI